MYTGNIFNISALEEAVDVIAEAAIEFMDIALFMEKKGEIRFPEDSRDLSYTLVKAAKDFHDKTLGVDWHEEDFREKAQEYIKPILLKEYGTRNEKFGNMLANEEEFARFCAAIGGHFIHISPGGKDTVNVLEISPKDRRATDAGDGIAMDELELFSRIQTLHTVFNLLLLDISPEEDRILDDAMILAYRKKGITHENDSFWDPKRPGKYKKMPTLNDIYDEIKNRPEARRLAEWLRWLMDATISD